MDRRFYIDLANSGLRMPIGTDLVLHEKPDHARRVLDGQGLGQVMVEAAQRYHTPLAYQLMDLMVEKADLMNLLGVPLAEADSFHFQSAPSAEAIAQVDAGLDSPPTPRMRANIGAIEYVAKTTTLVPVGMVIGPFSLMTKLLADPITPCYLAGDGATGQDDPEVLAVERCLELAIRVILRSIRLQARAGAKAICVCEPAANKVYLSPNQLAAGSQVFERLVMNYDRQVRAALDDLGVDLVLHNCGELTDQMVKELVTLDPAVLSLGSSRKLWEDARIVPRTTVLFGNLPTKKFYSDADVPVALVQQMTRELVARMKGAGHPHIVGSECDVLSVPGREKTLREKVEAMLTAR